MVKEDQLSLAIGRRGQNVRLASKLVGWDIEIMTMDELNEGIARAEGWFTQIPNVTTEMVERFIEEGFLSYDDLTFVEPAELGELIGVSEEEADDIIMFAEEAAERVEKEKAAAGESEGRVLAPQRHIQASAATALFGETPTPHTETKPTLDSLFGPADQEMPVAAATDTAAAATDTATDTATDAAATEVAATSAPEETAPEPAPAEETPSSEAPQK
jgi:N utilization substance protein A